MGLAPKTRILVAVDTESERMERLLSGHEVIVVSTSNEVRSLLERDDFGLVVLGVHFDESQMFSLLSDIRAHGRYRKVPILCVVGTRSRFISDVAIEGLDHAVKAMTANGLLNLEYFPDDEEGNARVRRIADYLILIDGDLQQLPRGTERSAPVAGKLLGEPRRRSDDKPH